ncbi:hypothetical protein Q9966_005693 [Columba livia]|nr:hypothetical protein Q9966_005693 [Columba livia]
MLPMAEQGSETPTVEWGGRTPMLGSPGGSWSISTVLGGSSTALHRQLSRDGACKDVTSQAHVKVAIYKQVVVCLRAMQTPLCLEFYALLGAAREPEAGDAQSPTPAALLLTDSEVEEKFCLHLDSIATV